MDSTIYTKHREKEVKNGWTEEGESGQLRDKGEDGKDSRDRKDGHSTRGRFSIIFSET